MEFNILYQSSSARHILLMVSIFGIPILLCFTLFCLLIYNFKTNTKLYEIKLKFRILSIIAIASFIITLVFYFISDAFDYDVFWGRNTYAMVSFFWGWGNATTYLLFVQRIHTVFGLTTYNPSKCTYFYFYSFTFLVWLCQMYIVVFFLLLLDSDINSYIALNNINTVNAIEIILQLMLSTSLIYIFYHKLNQIMVVHKEQDAFLKVVAKLTLLATFTASTTCLWLICAGIMDVDWIFYPTSSMKIKYILHFLTAIALMIDCTVNSIVIFLYFSFSDRYYRKICSLCDACCIVKCREKRDNSIRKIESNKTETITLRKGNVPLKIPPDGGQTQRTDNEDSEEYDLNIP